MFYIQEVSAIHITGAAQELAFHVGAVGNAVAGLQRSHCTALRADGCGGDRNISNSASNSQCCFLVNLTRATARLFQLPELFAGGLPASSQMEEPGRSPLSHQLTFAPPEPWCQNCCQTVSTAAVPAGPVPAAYSQQEDASGLYTSSFGAPWDRGWTPKIHM